MHPHGPASHRDQECVPRLLSFRRAELINTGRARSSRREGPSDLAVHTLSRAEEDKIGSRALRLCGSRRGACAPFSSSPPASPARSLTLPSGSPVREAPRLLPNGLVDAVATPELEGPALTTTEASGGAPSDRGSPRCTILTHPSHAVTRLLNPCNCLRGGKCICCSVVKRAAPKAFPADDLPAPAASTSSLGGCCSSSAVPVPGPVFFDDPPDATPLCTPPAPDVSADILVSPTLVDPSPPALASSTAPAPPPTAPPDALFLPPTHGTHACFCGPTCGCVGCAVHDPHSRKRPAPGACSGGGCRCGTAKGCEGGGKRARVDMLQAPEKGGCCSPRRGSSKVASAPGPKPCCGGSGDGADVTGGTRTLVPSSSGIELPSLWAHGTSAFHAPFTSFRPATSPAISKPLPSLRTLYPALLDLEIIDDGIGEARPPSIEPTAPHAPLEEATTALVRELNLPALSAATSTPLGLDQAPADCSAVYLQDPLDDACGQDPLDGNGARGQCHCSSECGCRGGTNAGKGKEDEMARLAQLAALGAFG